MVSGRTRILLVDDNAILRVAMRAMLSREPTVDLIGEAEDGQIAVRLADDLRPDVVLMDVQMPGMGGIEATRHILAAAAANGWATTVIGMSASSGEKQDMLDAGAVAFLAKDRAFELSDLLKNL